MNKIIDEKRSRIIYTGKIFELKKYLECLADEIPSNKEKISEAAGRLENITETDYFKNNIHTGYEKLYFNKEKILYSSRDDWSFPIVKKNAKKADEWFLNKNLEDKSKINQKTIGYYYLFENLGKSLITKIKNKFF